MWSVPKTADKPYAFKYSLVYIVNGVREVGYDNAEQKGDHRHYKELEEPYMFASLEKLAENFYRDVEKIKKDIGKSGKSGKSGLG